MIFPGLPTLWVPLDVTNLVNDWPRWKQSFEILIVAACNNELEDRQKLAILLHCLGFEGRSVVNEWFPELMNFNELAAQEITFALVWNRMNAHLQSLPVVNEELINTDEQIDQSEDESVVEEDGMAQDVNVEDVLECYRREIHDASSVNDYLTLFHLEKFIDRDPKANKWVVHEYLKRGNQLIIDTLSYQSYPIGSNPGLYLEYGKVAQSVKIIVNPSHGLSSFLDLMMCFKNITELSISSVRLTNVLPSADLNLLPRGLRKLELYDSVIAFLFPWLKLCKDSLEYLHISNVSYGDSRPPVFSPDWNFNRMKSLTIINNKDRNINSFPFIDCPALEKLYLDVVHWYQFSHHSQLTSLTIRSYHSSELSRVKSFTNLQHLEILEPVPKEFVKGIESLGLKSMKVTYH